MCRLLLVTGEFDPLIVADAFQCMARGDNADHGHPLKQHPDGWGAASWSKTGTVHVHRDANPAFLAPVAAIASRLEGEALALHARHTFCHRRGLDYCHPLQRGGTVFMHNGVVPGLDEKLGRPTRLDSEDLLEYLTNVNGHFPNQYELAAKLRQLPNGTTSANVIAFDGFGAVIINWFDQALDHHQFYTLFSFETSTQRIVSSEPLPHIAPREKWQSLGHGHIERIRLVPEKGSFNSIVQGAEK